MWKIALFAVTKLIVIATLCLPTAQAEIVSTSDYLERQSIEVQRTEIMTELQRQEVRRQLAAMGVAPAAIEARVAALSDTEVARMATEMDELPAGAAMGATTLVLVIILLVVLL